MNTITWRGAMALTIERSQRHGPASVDAVAVGCEIVRTTAEPRAATAPAADEFIARRHCAALMTSAPRARHAAHGPPRGRSLAWGGPALRSCCLPHQPTRLE